MKETNLPTKGIIMDDGGLYMRIDLNDVPEMVLSAVKPDRIVWYEMTSEGYTAIGGVGCNEEARRLENEYQDARMRMAN